MPLGSKIAPDQFPRCFSPGKSLVAIGVRLKRSLGHIEYRRPISSIYRRTVPDRVQLPLAAFNRLQKLIGRLKPFGTLSWRPVPWALRFDDEALDDFLEKVADTRHVALKRKAAAN